MSGVKNVAVGEDEPDQRLDRWFRRHWPGLSQGRIEKMCRKGEIRVDGARAKASSRIGPGQIVRVPPIGAATAKQQSSQTDRLDDADIRSIRDTVIYRDDQIIVLNKPPGLAVQGGSRQKQHLGILLPALRFDRNDDPKLVHRLDKDTSGLLVLARSGAAANNLSKQFRSRGVEKIYLAAVAGRPDPDAGTIRYGLVKAGGKGDERMRIVHPDEIATTEGAQWATTDFRVIEQAASRLAAVVLRPVTGRTHQLRAHMAAIGCPIAGDGKYGSRSQENAGDGWGAGLGGGLSRKLHLHAARLSFSHPETGQKMTMNADLPEHMARTWSMMGWQFGELPCDPFDPD